jgi:hypothetical protein
VAEADGHKSDPVKMVTSIAIVRGCGRVRIQQSRSRSVDPTLPSWRTRPARPSHNS